MTDETKSKSALDILLDPDRSCCEKNPGSGPCPFQSEIHDNDEECSCCDTCRQQCSDAI